MEQDKKCPLCAEAIPLAAVSCEYCGARFEVTRTGYCQTCHDVREADENGHCKVCGNAVADLRVENRLIEEPVREPLPASQPIAQSEITRIGRSRLPIGILAGVLILAVVGAFLWFGRNRLPAVSSLLATPTPTLTITFMPSPTLTSTPTVTPTLTIAHQPTRTSSPTTIPPLTLNVIALIDGTSQLIIKGDSLHWYHIGAFVPSSIYINSQSWGPTWPNKVLGNRNCLCNSSSYFGIPTLARQNQIVSIIIIRGRSSVKIIQQPNVINDFTLIIEFDDSEGGAAVYEINIGYLTP